jgi:predicted nucleic acid-binding protein
MAVPVYADTSFLVSLYLQDANSARAVADAPQLLPVFLTPLAEHELRNAIRLCVFRRQIATTQREKALHDLESDKTAGVLHAVPLDWPKVLRHAEALGRRHTETLGARGMDILHVASALALKAGRFVTFDERQRELAHLAGLATR